MRVLAGVPILAVLDLSPQALGVLLRVKPGDSLLAQP